ncbi:MAG: alkaline phosphatase family protein, partial [Gaiellaceae bacterium]
MRRRVWLPLAAAVAGTLVVLLFGFGVPPGAPRAAHAATAPTGIHKIRHVVVIMQENRSFDSYFGTYPGADGIPMRNGVPTVCSPDPTTGRCVKPFHDARDRNAGGPHDHLDAVRDIARGKMNGFVSRARRGRYLACVQV